MLDRLAVMRNLAGANGDSPRTAALLAHTQVEIALGTSHGFRSEGPALVTHLIPGREPASDVGSWTRGHHGHVVHPSGAED